MGRLVGTEQVRVEDVVSEIHSQRDHIAQQEAVPDADVDREVVVIGKLGATNTPDQIQAAIEGILVGDETLTRQDIDAERDVVIGIVTVAIAEDLSQARGKFLKLVLNDAKKEFDEAVRTGFGQDGEQADAAADFTAVRGEFDTNKFVVQMRGDLDALAERIERFKEIVARLN